MGLERDDLWLLSIFESCVVVEIVDDCFHGFAGGDTGSEVLVLVSFLE